MGSSLPVIVGFGGYNAAGRSSFHQGFRRMVLESLSDEEQQKTLVGLACLMRLVTWEEGSYQDKDGNRLSAGEVAARFRPAVLDGTLIRKVELFDPSFALGHKHISFESTHDEPMRFTMSKRDLPHLVPEDWQITEVSPGQVEVVTRDKLNYLVESHYVLASKAAGQLPSGFNPGEHYNSRFHPRGLQMALAGASDAVHSTGILWQKILDAVHPDEVGVYASSVMSQMQEEAFGGLLQARLRGGRTTSKQVPMGLNSMPADFLNAYVLGSLGHTEAITGACASFLYVLQAGIRDIQSGKRRVAVVGNAEAPVTPEIMEGFINMSALVNDDNLAKLDGLDTPDWRRASRPFGHNCGFTMAESAQYMILMDDALAVELGAQIHGSVPDVFINADGVKKSISSPGAGNYLSFGKAVASAARLLGIESVRKHSYILAHGSSTPANRVTESEIIDRIGAAFDITQWPVTAPKSFIGHSMSAASGDQVVSALGTFKYDIIPGIKTVDEIAPDVYQERAQFLLRDKDVSNAPMQAAFVNSKGFGGNNATALIVSAERTAAMLAKRHAAKMNDYQARLSDTLAAATAYEERADQGQLDVIYRFGEALIDEGEIQISQDDIRIPGYSNPVTFDKDNPWQDMV